MKSEIFCIQNLFVSNSLLKHHSGCVKNVSSSMLGEKKIVIKVGSNFVQVFVKLLGVCRVLVQDFYF